MLKLYKYEGKSREDLLKKIYSDLNVEENELIIKEEITEAKLFKAKKIELTVIIKNEVKEEIKNFLRSLSLKMNMEIHSEITEKDSIFNIILISDNNSVLIGKDGKTLNSIQLILRQYINNNLGNLIRLNVDVSNYKAKKQRNIEYEIKKIAREVLKTKIEVKLDSMNSYERRIVHNIINEFEQLLTESIGEEPNRCVIIKYKEK